MPDCYFGLSGSYSFGARLLYYNCIFGTIALTAYRVGRLPHLGRPPAAWIPIIENILSFLLSTYVLFFAVAVIHYAAMGVMGLQTNMYRYVTDLDAYATAYLASLGAAAWAAFWPLWPWDLSTKQGFLINAAAILLYLPMIFVGVKGAFQSTATECLDKSEKAACALLCPTRPAPFRKGGQAFTFDGDFILGSTPLQTSIVVIGGLILHMEIWAGEALWYSGRPESGQEIKFWHGWPRRILWVAFSAVGIANIIKTEFALHRPPFSSQAERLSSIGQWGLMVSGALAITSSVVFMCLADATPDTAAAAVQDCSASAPAFLSNIGDHPTSPPGRSDTAASAATSYHSVACDHPEHIHPKRPDLVKAIRGVLLARHKLKSLRPSLHRPQNQSHRRLLSYSSDAQSPNSEADAEEKSELVYPVIKVESAPYESAIDRHDDESSHRRDAQLSIQHRQQLGSEA